MNGAFGYGLPGDMGPVLGAVYVNKLIERCVIIRHSQAFSRTLTWVLFHRFTNSSGDAAPIYLEFGHDTTIDLALTGLGLIKDSPALRTSVKGPVRKNRVWRTSSQVPFAAQMVWEKFTCSSSYVLSLCYGLCMSRLLKMQCRFQGPQVRLLLNDSPLPLSTCKKMNKKFGTCSLDDFVTSSASATKLKWGDASWNSTCGNPGI